MTAIAEPAEASPDECSLFDAAKNGNLTEIHRLLAKGLNVNARDHRDVPWDVTPLMHACRYGNGEAVQALLGAGADVRLYGHEAIARQLLDAGAKPSGKAAGHTVLGLATLRGLEATVKVLLGMKVNPDTRESDKSVPLHHAAMYGHAGIVDLLLASGAQIDPKNEVGETPLAPAASFQHAPVVSHLLSAGANPNEPNVAKQTPLSHVASTPALEISELLLNGGANLNVQDREGCTPLDVAIRCRERKMAVFLRERGALAGEELKRPATRQPPKN